MAGGSRKSPDTYETILGGIVELLESARRASAHAVNSVMTATYWELGRRIVEIEQAGAERAGRNQGVLKVLSEDLTSRFGRGFSVTSLQLMRRFYLGWRNAPSCDGAAASGKQQTLSVVMDLPSFPLPWSHYVALLAVRDKGARSFYEREALAGGWSIRQLKRQIGSQSFERAALSRDEAKVLRAGESAQGGDQVSAEEEVKDPLVLEFLGLKDEYSESDLEESASRGSGAADSSTTMRACRGSKLRCHGLFPSSHSAKVSMDWTTEGGALGTRSS